MWPGWQLCVACRDAAVSSVMAFGCVVDFAVGKSGLVHVSELDTSRTPDATATWKVGDKMDVKILDYEKASGRCKLSRYCTNGTVTETCRYQGIILHCN